MWSKFEICLNLSLCLFFSNVCPNCKHIKNRKEREKKVQNSYICGFFTSHMGLDLSIILYYFSKGSLPYRIFLTQGICRQTEQKNKRIYKKTKPLLALFFVQKCRIFYFFYLNHLLFTLLDQLSV